MSQPLPASILVVRLGAIGDVTNALAFASACKAASPDTRIGWAVHPLAHPLVEGHPAVDRVHLWERGGGWSEWRRLVREIRDERYELAVDLQRIAKSSWLARSSGAPRVLGYDRRRAKELSWLLTREHIPRGSPHAHMVEQVMEFASYLGLASSPPRRDLPADERADVWARATVEELGGSPILVNLGASKPENRWPAARFGEVARRLLEDHGPVALIGGPGDRAAAVEALSAGGGGIADLVGKTDLRQLYHLMERSRLFVGCDTGPMHLAASRGLPVVAIFGPADPRRTGPWGPQHHVLRRPPAPETGPAAPGRTEAIGVDEVCEAALGSLQATGQEFREF